LPRASPGIVRNRGSCAAAGFPRAICAAMSAEQDSD